VPPCAALGLEGAGAAVNLDGGLVRARLAYRYNGKLLRLLVDAGDPDPKQVADLLLGLDDIAVEVESCRAELRAIWPGTLP